MTSGRRGFATSDMTQTPVSTPTPDIRKRDVRRAARERRRLAHRASAATAGQLLRDRFLAEQPLPSGAVVAGYAPMGEEIDVLPLLHALAGRGHACALPVVVAPAAPLAFRAWHPGMTLVAADFGVGVPPPSSEELRPTVLLVPLLAFDRAGHRIGYGAGFYDRTLAALRGDGDVLAIGVAYAEQEVDAVPVDGNDAALDLIITDRSTIRPRG